MLSKRSTYFITVPKNHIKVESKKLNLNDGVWHTLVVERVGKNLTLYIDGNFDNTASGSGIANIHNGNEFRLGRSMTDPNIYTPKADYRNLIVLLKSTIAEEAVVFDTKKLKDGVIDTGAVGMNLNWCIDSDVERPRKKSNSKRLKEMKCSSLRFPAGGVAGNYLWDTPPYGGTLTPKVGSMSKYPTPWDWCTCTDGTFKKDMDFDEYMSMCSKLNTEPLVVVNSLSHKYSDGPDYETLKTTAVEWVKYAKSKGYKVAYWQIGNEVDHKPYLDLLPKLEYIDLYIDFAKAMKDADSSIKCGPGILSDSSYYTDIVKKRPELIDFTSCHQYMWGKRDWRNYAGWRDAQCKDLTPNVSKMQDAVNESSKRDIPILITETNSLFAWENNDSALYKGLAFFDILFCQQELRNVKYSYMWTLHSPWYGEDGGSDAIDAESNALYNTDDNDYTPNGRVSYILNNTAEQKYMIPDNKIHGKTMSYGSYTPQPQTGKMTLYLIQKDDNPVIMNVTINNYNPGSDYERWVFKGSSPEDPYPKYKKGGTINFTSNGFSTILDPCSLTVIILK